MKDTFNRTIDYMRISITDRCNLRCKYCMPQEGIEKVSMSKILTYEEILRICRASVTLGINRFKITGGEPLVRKGCPDLCREIKQIPGVEQVTITTNGQLLKDYMPKLIEAGIDGINVSLDSLQEDRYRLITGGGILSETLKGLDAAQESGIRTKVNCLLQKNFNEDELLDFAEMAFGRGIDVRFIEIMPIGFGKPDTGLSNEIVLQRLQAALPQLTLDQSTRGNGPAVYYAIPGKPGSIGLISAMHGRFCESCNRIRLTSQGQIKPCLCYEDSCDLKPALAEQRDERLVETLRDAIGRKPSGHTFEDIKTVERRSMVEIGG